MRFETLKRTMGSQNSKSLSYYDLAYYYCMAAYTSPPTQEEKAYLMSMIKMALRQQWRNSDILDAINAGIQANKHPPSCYLDFLATHNKKNGEVNFIDIDRTYVHSFMLILPSPPSITWDDDAGDISVSQTDYYVENKCEITLMDLCNYYRDKLCKTYGQAAYFNERYALSILKNWLSDSETDNADLILHAMDASIALNHNSSQASAPSFTKIQDYMLVAREQISSKITELMVACQGGDTFVTPKPRQLLY